MPIYGEAKRRDMIRSILPSTSRKNARENLAAIRRRNRRNIRQVLTDYTHQTYLAEDPCEAIDDFDRDDVRYFPVQEIMAAMWERRGADKVAPIMRWAERVTKDIDDPVDRYMYLKKMLPDNTIGRHALSHLKYVDGITEPGENPYLYSYLRRTASTTAEPNYAALLGEVIESGRVRLLNTAIKNVHTRAKFQKEVRREKAVEKGGSFIWVRFYEPGHKIYNRAGATPTYNYVPCNCKPRILAGLHDIDAFIHDVIKNNAALPHPEWQAAAKKFLGVGE